MNAWQLSVSEASEPEPATFRLAGQELVVGRDEAVDLVVAEASVSARHGRFAPAGRGYSYTDLGSTNGSALSSAGGAPVPCEAGVPVMLTVGDVLCLGDRERAVQIRVETVAGRSPGALEPHPGPLPLGRTVIAKAPLADLMTDSVSELAGLAAHVMTVATPAALAEHALAFLSGLAPHAAQRGVALWGPGVAVSAGDAIPRGLIEAAMADSGLAQAELLSEGSATPLPQTTSLASQGTRTALVIPLATRAGARSSLSWGLMVATSPLGAAAFVHNAVERAAIAATLIALGAAELSRRLDERNRVDALASENARMQSADSAPLGRSKAFVEVVQMARQVAPTDVPLLITGETGSGKEVLARFVHKASLRANKGFVAFNCAAIPENLIESELFGYQRGSFTGAVSDRKGLFEEAHQGTLFLDEIGEMPALMQAKLLRVLQDGEVRRVGAQKPVHVDVRVVSATHRDLNQMVAQGGFRADLMYRLNAVNLRLPPLRERGDDVALLAHVLLSRAAAQCHKRIPGFSPDALWALSMHPFPGNIRELDNEILRAAALTPDGQSIGAAVFSDSLRKGVPVALAGDTGEVLPLKECVARAERAAIETALERSAGNVTETARALGVTRPGLYKAMERLGLARRS